MERNVDNPYDQSDDSKYTSYWKAIENDQGETIGVIGMQLAMASYSELIPASALEEPYSLSLIALYDKNLEPIWWWGCAEESNTYISE